MAILLRCPSSSVFSLASIRRGFRSSCFRRAVTGFHRRKATVSASYPESGCLSTSKAMLKGMKFPEFEKWVQSSGFRPAQALMLWKCLYGNNSWAHSHDELTGLNKDFRKMLCGNAEIKALSVKDIIMAADGTRKEVADIVHFEGWIGDRNSCNSMQQGKNYCLCFKSSRMCNELPVLLYWKDGFEEAFDYS